MILLLRHGETFWNREARIQGHMESDLTPLGESQAAAMASLVADLVRQDGGAYAGLDRQTTLDQDVPQNGVYRLQNGQIDRFDCEPVE